MTFCSTNLEMCWWWPNKNCHIIFMAPRPTACKSAALLLLDLDPPGPLSNVSTCHSPPIKWPLPNLLQTPVAETWTTKTLPCQMYGFRAYSNLLNFVLRRFRSRLTLDDWQSQGVPEVNTVLNIVKVSESGQWSKMVQRPHACFSPWIRLSLSAYVSVTRAPNLRKLQSLIHLIPHLNHP